MSLASVSVGDRDSDQIAVRTSFLSKRKLRRNCSPRLELLEQRRVLSGVNDNALLAALETRLFSTGQEGLSAWTDQLTSPNLLGRTLPMLGNHWIDEYSPREQLNALLAPLSGPFSSLGDLQAALNAVSGINVSDARDLEDKLELDLQFTRTVARSTSLGSTFGDLALDFEGTVDFSVTMNFAFTAGAVWDAQAQQAIPYVATDNDQLSVAVTLNQIVVAGGAGDEVRARLGFLDVSLSDVSGAMSAELALDLADPGTEGDDGRITPGELSGTDFASAAVSGSFAELSATIASSFTAAQTLTLAWPDLNDPSQVTTNLPSLGNLYEGLGQLTAGDFAAAFTDLSTWTGLLNNANMLGRPLPILGTQLADVVDLGGWLKTLLVDDVGAYVSLESLLSRLRSTDDFSDVNLNVEGDQVRYVLQVDSQLHRDVGFDLGLSALQLKLSAPDMELTADVTGQLTIGVDFSQPTAPEFYLGAGPSETEFHIDAGLHLPHINASGGVGFLSVEVANGSAELTAHGDIVIFSDSGRLGIAALADLPSAMADLGSSVDYQISGSAQASLPISAPILQQSEKTISVTWDDLTNLDSAVVEGLDQFADLLRFDAITPETFSSGLEQLFGILTSDGFRSNAVLQYRLPLVNKKVGELVDVAEFVRNSVTFATELTEDGAAPFATADELLSLLQQLPGADDLSVSVSATDDDLRYHLSFAKAFEQTLPIDLDLGVMIDLETSGEIAAQLSAVLDITFGVDQDNRFFIVETPGQPQLETVIGISAEVNAAARLGFLDVAINNATASMSAGISLELTDPGTDADPPSPQRITGRELVSSNLSQLAQLEFDWQGAQVELPLSTSLFADTATLSAEWSDFDQPPAVNTDEIEKFYRFQGITVDTVLDGLKNLPALLDQLTGAGGMGGNLALIGANLKPLIGVADQLRGWVDELQDISTSQRLRDELERVLGLDPGSLLVEVLDNDPRFGNDIQFVVQFQQTIDSQTARFAVDQPVNLSVGDVGLNVHGQGTLAGSLVAGVRFGLNLSEGIPPSDRFYIAVGDDSRVELTAAGAASLEADLNFGLGKIDIASGNASLTGPGGQQYARLALDFHDPGPTQDHKITFGEFLDQPAGVFGGLACEGAAHVQLQLVKLPGMTDNPTLTLSWPDICDIGSLELSGEESLEEYLNVAITFDASTAIEGLRSIIQMIEGWAGVDVLNTKLPLINESLGSLFPVVADATSFFRTIEDANPLNYAAFDSAIFAAADALGQAVTVVHAPAHDPAAEQYRYLVTYAFQYSDELEFDYGSSLLNLEFPLEASVNLDATLEFGLNRDKGFFLVDVGDAPEIQMSFAVGATEFAVEGRFGPLRVGVAPQVQIEGQNDPVSSAATAIVNFDVDLVDADGQITTSDLFGNFAGVVQTSIGGAAQLLLPLGARLGNDGPGVIATFEAHWDAADPDRFGFGPDRGPNPLDGFANVDFVLGEFVDGIVTEVLRKVDAYNPLSAELISVLHQKLPILDKTPIEVLKEETDFAEIGLLLDVATLLATELPDYSPLDLSSYFAGESPPAAPLAGESEDEPAYFQFLDSLRDDYDISLPLFDDPTGSIVKVFLGEDVDLIRWDPDPFRAEWSYQTPSYPFFSYGLPGIVEISASAFLGATVALFADLELGLGTRGLKQVLGGNEDVEAILLNGFFIGDNRHDFPPDEFEVGVEVDVHVGIQGEGKLFGFSVVEVTGKAGVQGTVGVDLADLKDDPQDPQAIDGKARVGRLDQGGDNHIYLDEIEFIAAGWGPHCAVTPGGKVDVFASIEASVLGGWWDIIDESVRFTLVDWEYPCKLEWTDLAAVEGDVLKMHATPYPDVGQTILIKNVEVNGLKSDIVGVVAAPTTSDVVTVRDPERYFLGVPLDWAVLAPLPEIIRIEDPLLKEEIRTSVSVVRNADGAPAKIRVLRQRQSGTTYEDFDIADLAGVHQILIEGTPGRDEVFVDPTLTEVLPITHVRVSTGLGNDRVEFGEIDSERSHLLTTFIETGYGNDTVAGTPVADVILGGGGNDLLSGFQGADQIYGGAGNDVVYGGSGDDTLDGETGRDRLFGGQGSNLLLGGPDDDEIYGDEDIDIIEGGKGADLIVAGGGNDVVHGNEGRDRIHGSAGDDELYGDADRDTIYGDEGLDYVEGGEDNDKLYGGGGDDLLYGGGGDDVVSGDAGNDALYGEEDNDHLQGGLGADVLYGGTGSDTLQGGAGNDSLHGGEGHDRLAGGDQDDLAYGDQGNDQINGDRGFDTLFGGDGDDYLYGGDDDDSAYGDAGDDRIRGDQGNDLLRGEADNDTIYGGSGQDLVLGGDGQDLLYGDEDEDQVDGEAGADSIFGGPGNDHLYGSAGDDQIHGGPGQDAIDGGGDNDSVHGDEDPDFIEGGSGDDQLYGDTGDDRILGGDGDDQLFGGDDDDLLYGQAGNDLLHGESHRDQLYGGPGVDQLNGGPDDDVLVAGAGIGNVLNGGDGDDRIHGAEEGGVDFDFNDLVFFGDVIDGGPGRDQVWGLGGSDYILGGDGDDLLDGGAGLDYIRGGAGDDLIYATAGDGNQLFGDEGRDVIYGSDEGADYISGGLQGDQIYAQGGDDRIHGDAGDDFLDGGFGADTLYGGSGDDVLHAGGGVGDVLYGEDGSDVLHGSDDGGDIADGGPGNDRVLGYGGNDQLRGGSGDDILDGGQGDDTIAGDAGRDLLLGAAHHDVLYGHNATGAGDDLAVDYVYGDFGADGDALDAGRDRLYGGGGNDRLFGEGDDDYIDAGAGTDDLVDYGSGESGVPEEFVEPPPTPDPIPQTAVGLAPPPASLPSGVVDQGRWSELANSASGRGLSGDLGLSVSPSLVVTEDRQYVAWADSRNGNFEIYVAQHERDGWGELAGSAHGGGVSDSETSSRYPSIALDVAGQALIAWTEQGQAGSDIYLASFDANANQGQGGWVALGTSLQAGGISGSGRADRARVVNTAAGPVVVWIDRRSGAAELYAQRFDGSTWQPLGAGPISAAGALGQLDDVAVATQGDQLAVAWGQLQSGVRQIFVKAYAAGAWNELAHSASGTGVSGSDGESREPTLAYHDGSLFAAWQDRTSDVWEIYAVRYSSGAGWEPAGSGAAADGGVSGTRGAATLPQLRSGGGALYLAWADDLVQSGQGQRTALYVKTWRDGAFVEKRSGDARAGGVSDTGRDVQSLALAVDAAGHPLLAWQDVAAGHPEIYLRGDFSNYNEPYYATSATSVSEILQQNDLGDGDLIIVQAPQAAGFVVGDDAGVTILGTPGASIAGPVVIDQTHDVTLQRLVLAGGLTITDSDRITLRESSVPAGGVTVDGGSDIHVSHNTLLAPEGLILTGGAQESLIEYNVLGGDPGLSVTGAGAVAVDVRFNRFSGNGDGIALLAEASGRLEMNQILLSMSNNTGLIIAAPFEGVIRGNEISGAEIGVSYAAAANLSGNRLHHNDTGILVTADSIYDGLGFVGEYDANLIYENVVGVDLRGHMQGQHVHHNTTGVIGAGVLGGSDLEQANRIENNATGVSFLGTIQFNRIAGNDVGIQASDRQLITHNLVYGNEHVGVNISNRDDVRIVQNTFYATTGDNLRLTNGSSNIEVRGNLLWAESGYDIYVADDSTIGFFSDYNDLHAGDAGKLVYWTRDFTDVLDWREDVDQFDLHSTGRTRLNPLWSQPQFLSRATHDFQVFDLLAGQRFSSITRGAGDPRADQGIFDGRVNLLANSGFESGLIGWDVNAESSTKTGSPAAFEGTQYFDAGPTPVGYAAQSIDLLAAGFSAAELDSEDLQILFGGRVRSAEEAEIDGGEIQVLLLDQDDNLLREARAPASNRTDRWELLGDSIRLPAGTRKVLYRFQATRAPTSGGNDSYLDHAFLYVTAESFAPELGAYGNLPAEAGLDAATRIALVFPDLYTDWESEKQREIRWATFQNLDESLVRIDVFQDHPDHGPEFLVQLSPGTPDDGQFEWIPAYSGIGAGTYGLRIQVTLLDHPTVFDRSAESFAIPEDTLTYYVNDASDSANPGDNRNTGRVADAPKPYPNNVLRIYTLQPADTLFIEAGDYPLLSPLVISGSGVRGDDEGFQFVGSAEQPVTLRHANPFTVAPIVELDDADYVSMSYLEFWEGQTGLLIHKQSTNFVGSHLVASRHAQDGIHLAADSAASLLEFITAAENGDDGIDASGRLEILSDSVVHHNQRCGINLQDPGNAIVEGNESYSNGGHGIYVSNDVAGTRAIIGNLDLSLGRGNRVYNNFGDGIHAFHLVSVIGNTAFGQTGTGATGIYLSSADARHNVVHSNLTGISALGSSADVSENRVYNNTGAGIITTGVNDVIHNVVYSNRDGIRTVGVAYDGDIRGNVVYAQRRYGVYLRNGDEAEIINNTIYQPLGDAVRIEGSPSTIVRNNVMWVDAGYALAVDRESQVGFASDYNLLRATGSGRVGQWQDAARKSLEDWQRAAFSDQHSLDLDPWFVDAVGADGVLGYGGANYDGQDDDFHLQSRYGSLHGGALAPVLDAGSGMPVMPPGVLTVDPLQSPAIDRGDDAFSLDNEPLPNGGYINLGAYGDTTQASKSPSQYVLATRPAGGETWPVEQSFTVEWRSHDQLETVDIDLVSDNGGVLTTVLRIADDTPNDGQFLWSIPASVTPAENYRIQILRGTLEDTSDFPFTITGPVHEYYVNDDAVESGDWTSAAGSAANDGLTPATPKASILDVLASYDLGSEDVIYVDAGSYTLTANIAITGEDSGVEIVGYHDVDDADRHALLDRDNTAAGSYVFELSGADQITLDHLHITGGEYGVYAASGGDNDDLTISHSTIYGNYRSGVRLDESNDRPRIIENTVYGIPGGASGDNQANGLEIRGSDALIGGNTVYDSSGRGIVSDGPRAVVDGNELYGNYYGIFTGAYSEGTVISGNLVHDNTQGIVGRQNVLARENTVYGHSNLGISLYGTGSRGQGNVVFDNTTGILVTSSGSVASGNRVYRNSTAGIQATGSAVVEGNTVYDNQVGILASSFDGIIEHNLVFDQTEAGIQVSSGKSGSLVQHNTIYEPLASAVHVRGASSDVRLRNNIIWVESAYAIRVENDSQNGFDSDYNLFHTAAAGRLAWWQNREFAERVDWLYEVGQDRDSLQTDPTLTDPDLEYLRDPRFVDPLGPDGFPSWVDAGLTAHYFDNGQLAGAPVVIRTDSEIDFTWSGAPTTGVPSNNFSVRWDGYLDVPEDGDYTFYTQADDGERLYLDDVLVIDQWIWDGGIEQSYVAVGLTAGWHSLKYEMHEVSGQAQAVLSWEGPGISKQVIGSSSLRTEPTAPGDYSFDNDFHLQSNSPAIDRGAPESYYLSEPRPSGGRSNLGAYGNTLEAASNPASGQILQLLSPNGWEKFEVGQELSVRWRSAGLTGAETVALVNAGGGVLDNWLAEAYRTTGGTGSTWRAIDTSNVADAAPQTVYRTYSRAETGIGQMLTFELPVPDGQYQLRLHFADPLTATVGNRVFDIHLQDVLVHDDFDIAAAAGGRYVAVDQNFSVTASGGRGIQLDLINETSSFAILAALEVTAVNPLGAADPRVNLEFSADDGVHWTSVEQGLMMDRFGRGSFTWTAGAETTGNTAMLRVASVDAATVHDASDEAFLIANDGTNYYVNDGSNDGDVFTTAIGHNAHSGKDSEHPMAGLRPLVATYDLDPGDTVYVDTGVYTLIYNVVLDSSDSGVRIAGPETAVALLDRGNTAAGSRAIQLSGADQVTLDHLSATGGESGIYAGSDADSDDLTIINSAIFSNRVYGVQLLSSNDRATVADNTLYGIPGDEYSDDQSSPLDISGVDAVITGNSVFGSGVGIYARESGALVRNNEVHGCFWGIRNTQPQTTIADNWVYDNNHGIHATNHATVIANVVHDNALIGITLANQSTATNNEVYDNGIGISLGGSTVASDNRVYNNRETGIQTLGDVVVRGNRVYTNPVGIQLCHSGSAASCSGFVENNLIFDSETVGIQVWRGTSSELVQQNTVYEPRAVGVWLKEDSDIVLRNNIIHVEAAAAIRVDNNSQHDVKSDYNLFELHDESNLGDWQGRSFVERSQWYHELGLDLHSRVGDPQFVDPAGPDGFLGWVEPGLAAAFFANEDLSGEPALRRLDSQIDYFWTSSPASGIPSDHFSVRWEGALLAPADGDYTIYTQTNDGERFYLDDTLAIDRWDGSGATEQSYQALGLAAGWHAIRYEMHDVTGDAQAVLSWEGPGIAKQVIGPAFFSTHATEPGDYSRDNGFHLQHGSPAIDQGDPTSYYLSEPAPNAGRANLGAYGNTPEATTSAAYPLVQVLSPNGLEKFESDQQVTLLWRSWGLQATETVALINAGGGLVDNWLPDAYGAAGATLHSTSYTMDTSHVADPAPAAVYRTYSSGSDETAGTLSYRLPVPAGEYQLRLHFAEVVVSSAGGRVFDISLQGNLVRDDFDIFQEAGGRYIATTQSFNVVAEDQGIQLDLRGETANYPYPILSAIELTSTVYSAALNPTVDFALSTDEGNHWSRIASGREMDRFGRGEYVWIPGLETTGNTALVRARVSDQPTIEDNSDATFLITNAGTNFYVNDSSLENDVFATMMGNNLASGKTPKQPMASLTALVAAYDLDPGDTIHVDAGSYVVYRDLELTASDSGVRITGPESAVALLDRGNAIPGRYLIHLRNADGVAVQHLFLTGADAAIYAGVDSDSDEALISDNTIYANDRYGVYLQDSNDGAQIADNTLYGIQGGDGDDDQSTSILLEGADGLIIGNTVHDSSTGIRVQGLRMEIKQNDVYANDSGIVIGGSGGGDHSVIGNLVHDNTVVGISVIRPALVSGNIVFGHAGSGDYGISLDRGVAGENEVFGNYHGIRAGNEAVVVGNRVFDNSNIGIAAERSGVAEGNYVYSNSVGIRGQKTTASFQGQISNNLVYDNANEGIVLTGASGAHVTNNTVFQQVGDALQIGSSSSNVRLRNNILWVEAGHDVYVASDSQTGFSSDYNLFQIGSDANAHVGSWGGAVTHTLPAWYAVSGQDMYSDDDDDTNDRSRFGDPLFADADGADNVLGYDATGEGYDGGHDDNFYRLRYSPATDRGDYWAAPAADIEGDGRVDDLGMDNLGGPDYLEQTLGSSLFSLAGAARNWRADNSAWTLYLPFSFPFYEETYTSVKVSSNGLLHFEGPDPAQDDDNSTAKMVDNRRIAPLWDNLRTNGSGDNIYVDTSLAQQVTIRWDATNEADESDVNFAVVLYADGRIRFDYGPGNSNLTPTIGLSQGVSQHFLLATYDARADLDGVNSVEFVTAPAAAYADMGALEYRGSSLDVTPPVLTGASPTELFTGEPTHAPIRDVKLFFSEELNPLDAAAPANYELREAGLNGVFGDDDDTLHAIVPSYQRGEAVVVLSIATQAEVLPPGKYQLTLYGETSIRDLSGLKLDGDGDGIEGGNFVQPQFIVELNQPPVAVNDSYDVTEDNILAVAVTAGVLANDSDADLDALSAILVAGPANGNVLLADDGSLLYTPARHFSGADSFVYRLDDGNEGTDTATVILTVIPVNDAPTSILWSKTTVDEQSPGAVVANVRVFDPDPGDTHSFVISDGRFEIVEGQLKLRDGLILDYESEPFLPLDITATDSGGLSLSRSYTIRVNDVNEPPLSMTLDELLVSDGVAGASAGTMAVTDTDIGDRHFFTVSDIRFQVVAGVLKLRDNETLDQEAEFTIDLSVTAFDSGTPSLAITQAFTLGVISQTYAWHNPFNRLDVNFDSSVQPVDALVVINYINAHGSGPPPAPPDVPPPFFDVNRDGLVAPIDVLVIINYLNAKAELESEPPLIVSAVSASDILEVPGRETSGQDPTRRVGVGRLGQGSAGFLRPDQRNLKAWPSKGRVRAVNECWNVIENVWPDVLANESPARRERFPQGTELEEQFDELEAILAEIAPEVGVAWDSWP